MEESIIVKKLLKTKLNSWNLDKKIYFFFTSVLCGISFVMLAGFTFSYLTSFIKQSNNITENQLSALASNYENTLDTYQEFAVALVIDDAIQEYLYSSPSDSNYYSRVNNAKSILQNAINMHSNISFIAVVNNNFNNNLYKGNITKIANNFLRVCKSDYENSRYCYKSGALRMSFNKVYIDDNHYTLNVYMPVYSTLKMINEIGLLCIIFDDSMFEGLSEDSFNKLDSEVFMVDGANKIVSSPNINEVGTEFKYADHFNKASAYFRVNSDLYSYKKVGNWNYYLVSRITLVNMYRDNILVVTLLILFSVMITYFSLIIFKRMLKKMYQPLSNVVKGMKCVAEGNLEVRISKDHVGNDFEKVADGFNYMMDKIIALMEQVKLEQQQLNQIRFNALQSQIQPHFLYNTLDCIYWQAKAEGNHEISVLVKALAQYYRLCLSKGKDVIPIEQEIEHIKNYLIIHNIRYDNIIESEIILDENCKDILIPKITLQPLVENSILHGIKVKEGFCGKLKIMVQKKSGEVFITVIDNGTGMTEEQIREMNNSISEYDKDFGYGVRNVNRRIQILFGKEYGLHYEENEFNGVTVTIHLPSHTEQQYEEVL